VLTLQSKPPRKRAADLIDTVMATVRQGGNVLLPCDTAGRTLELLLLLNMHWTQHRLGSYPLVLLHR
jgi:cleavage and polyadenylation specificity factor subunit 2